MLCWKRHPPLACDVLGLSGQPKPLSYTSNIPTLLQLYITVIYSMIFLPPEFRIFFQVPYALSPLFATLTKTAGGYRGYLVSSPIGTILLSNSLTRDLDQSSPLIRLSLFSTIRYAPFCAMEVSQPFFYQSLLQSCPCNGRGGVFPLSFLHSSCKFALLFSTTCRMPLPQLFSFQALLVAGEW